MLGGRHKRVCQVIDRPHILDAARERDAVCHPAVRGLALQLRREVAVRGEAVRVAHDQQIQVVVAIRQPRERLDQQVDALVARDAYDVEEHPAARESPPAAELVQFRVGRRGCKPCNIHAQGHDAHALGGIAGVAAEFLCDERAIADGQVCVPGQLGAGDGTREHVAVRGAAP